MKWSEFCTRMGEVGGGLDDEGERHLANQVACWLTYALGFTDVDHPAFFRSSDPVFQWGGPNANQVARRARITGVGTYRVHGTMGSCEEFALQIKNGGEQSGGATIALEISASSLGLGPGDDFSITLGGAPQPGVWFPLDADASFVHVRDYYFAWTAAPPATFVIERLDPPPGPRTPVTGAGALDIAATEVEHSMRFWNGYQDRMLADVATNNFTPPAAAGRGVQNLRYGHAGVSLAPDEALVVELDPAGAEWWDIQLYSRPWFESLDYATRTTSLNHTLAEPGPIIIAASDPGGPNWLDNEGRGDITCTVRLWRPTGEPTIRTRLVTLTDLAAAEPALDLAPRDRRPDIQRRVAHLAWRYRT
jgi:hypothetical protein